MERWTTRLAAGVLAILVVAACSAPFRPGAAHNRPSPSASAAPAVRPGSIDAFVPQAVSFVEAHRGLRFKQPVKVNHLSDAEFSQRIVSLQRRDRADTDRLAKLYRALGLIGRNVDVEKAEEELLSGNVVGYYDPKTKELVVRGDTATVSVKHVVVHELTHSGERPRVVDGPASDGAAFDRGVLGEVQTGVLLEGLVASATLTRDQEQVATRAWAGDRYVAWSSGDSYCLRVRYAARSAAGAAALGSALQKLASARPGAQVEL